MNNDNISESVFQAEHRFLLEELDAGFSREIIVSCFEDGVRADTEAEQLIDEILIRENRTAKYIRFGRSNDGDGVLCIRSSVNVDVDASPHLRQRIKRSLMTASLNCMRASLRVMAEMIADSAHAEKEGTDGTGQRLQSGIHTA